MSKELRSVVRQYEKDNDLVLQFLESRCQTDDDASITAKDLHGAFKIWAKSEGVPVLSARKFNAEMDRHSEWFERKAPSLGYMKYWGLKLKDVL